MANDFLQCLALKPRLTIQTEMPVEIEKKMKLDTRLKQRVF